MQAAAGAAEARRILSPYQTYELRPDPSGTFERTPLWAVHLLRLLEPPAIDEILGLAEAHVAAHGWSVSRHEHHPTTDFAVDAAPALEAHLRPLVVGIILPTLARLYGFEDEGEALRLRDLFFVRYEAGGQASLAPHRDGTLLSFTLLLSEPGVSFDGGGTAFASLGDACAACPPAPPEPAAGTEVAEAVEPRGAGCAACGGSGFAPLLQRLGDLTTHSGKLLHRAAAVTRGTRHVLVGFVEVVSPRVDAEFVEHHLLANSSKIGGWADHEVVGNAMLEEEEEVVSPRPTPKRPRDSDVCSMRTT